MKRQSRPAAAGGVIPVVPSVRSVSAPGASGQGRGAGSVVGRLQGRPGQPAEEQQHLQIGGAEGPGERAHGGAPSGGKAGGVNRQAGFCNKQRIPSADGTGKAQGRGPAPGRPVTGPRRDEAGSIVPDGGQP